MKNIGRIIFLMAILTFMSLIVSCSDPLTLNVSSIEMTVGEYVDLQEYANIDIGMVTVSDSNIATVICGTVVRAERKGVIKATVYGGGENVEMTIKISYSEPKLKLSCSSPLYTTVKGTVMDFYADIGTNADPNEQIYWYLNGSIRGIGKTFRLNADEYAIYKVTAKVGNSEQTLTAVCYRPFATLPTITSDFSGVMMPPYDSANFSASSDDAYIEWMINDEKVSIGKTFSFKPERPGEYVVSALVNGLKTNNIRIIASGVIKPENVLIDFDSDYPNVFLKWDLPVPLDCEVKVGDKVYNKNDDRFKDNTFNLTGLISLDKSVSVGVRCLGGQNYGASEFVNVSTPVVSDSAKKYLSNDYFDGNYYMSSDKEVYDIIEYAIVFRNGAEKTEDGAKKLTFDVYMGYDSDQTSALLLSKGWAYAEQTGRYRMSVRGIAKKGEIVNFELLFFTEIEPQDDDRIKNRSRQLITPNFESGLTKFPIDEREGASVSTSEQLYYVVQKGYKPLPVNGSAAQRIYLKAKQVLSEIASNDMDDIEKARVIYEWIMWHTTYDQSVVNESVSLAVIRPSYYLEGVFDYGFAVCDGISKSMSLLCNMVGVNCVRVVGTVETDDVSAHAWNYVQIDGNWFVVDATWGDAKIIIDNIEYESGIHSYFLRSQDELYTHKPNYPEKYPSANTFFNWYDLEKEYYDGTIDFYVDEATKIDDVLNDLTSIVNCIKQQMTFSVTVGEEKSEYDQYCTEIRLSQKAKTFLLLNYDVINLAIIALNNAHWIFYNDLLLIITDK